MKKNSTKDMAVEEWGGEPRKVEILVAFGIKATGKEYLVFTEDEEPDSKGEYMIEIVRINTSSIPVMSEVIEDEAEMKRVLYELRRLISSDIDEIPEGLYFVSLPEMLKPGALPS